MHVGCQKQPMSLRQGRAPGARSGPVFDLDRKALLRQFHEQHYVTGLSSLDNFWFLLYLAMTVVAKKMMAVKRVQHCFSAVLVYLVATLLVKALSRPFYHRWRWVLVLVLHLLMTAMRALSVLAMASEQAINWRPAKLSSRVSVFGFFLGMLGTSGGLIRNIELLGLQQEFSLHVAVSVVYVAAQLAAGMFGFRLGYCNAMFFTVHEVHDAVAAIANTLLDMLLGLPATQQQTCSSCPGVAVYTTVLLYSAVVVPLYACYQLERSAWRRFLGQAEEAFRRQQQDQQQHELAMAAAGSCSRGDGSRGGGSNSRISRGSAMSAGQQQQQQGLEMDGTGEPSSSAAAVAAAAAAAPVSSAAAVAEAGSGPCVFSLQETLAAAEQEARSRGSILAAVVVHILMLVCLLLLCWMLANAVALNLLPRILSRQQLQLWCPNRPYTPFVIAGEVYEGF